MYDIRRLTILTDFAEFGTMSAVSKHRGITPSAVSQHIKALEAEVGVALVERNGRTLLLTDEGRILVEHANRILAAVETARAAVHNPVTVEPDQISLSAFHTMLIRLGGSLLEGIARRRPGFRVNLVEESPRPAARSVRSGRSQLAVVYRHADATAPEFEGLAARVLFEDPVVVLAPVPARSRRAEGLRALADEDWITGTGDGPVRRALVESAHRAGFTPKLTHRARMYTSQVSLVRAGFGWAAVPRTAVPERDQELIAFELPAGLRTVEVIHAEGATDSAAITDVVDAIVDAAGLLEAQWEREAIA